MLHKFYSRTDHLLESHSRALGIGEHHLKRETTTGGSPLGKVGGPYERRVLTKNGDEYYLWHFFSKRAGDKPILLNALDPYKSVDDSLEKTPNPSDEPTLLTINGDEFMSEVASLSSVPALDLLLERLHNQPSQNEDDD